MKDLKPSMLELYIQGWLAPITCMADASNEEYLLELADAWHLQNIRPMIQQAMQQRGIELGTDEDLYVIAPTPIVQYAGQVRVTHYKNNGRCNGPISEDHYPDFTAAILELTLREPLDVVDGQLDRWMLQPRFRSGFDIAALVEKYNKGEISTSIFHQELARLAA